MILADPTELEVLVQRLHEARVLCLGDVMLDTFNHGSVDRISPERPVPVFRPGKIENILGGAANVARNVSALGAHCTLVGMVGDDEAGAMIREVLAADANLSSELITSPMRPTTHKLRYTAAGQHLLRLDNEDASPISPVEETAFAAQLRDLIARHDVVILSDYAKGLLTATLVQTTIAIARAADVPVIVDPKSRDFTRYRGATLITPNALEARQATDIAISDDAAAERAGMVALESDSFDAVLITRGDQGMSLIRRDVPAVHLPSDALEVFDVVGAGDTVLATLACAIGVGSAFDLAASCANVAAGIVVGKRDTATVAPDELTDRIARLGSGRPHEGTPILLDISEAATYAAARRAEGKRVGFTNGVFDIVHPGHVSILKFARNACDCLIVGVNSDASVRRLGKGPERPINTEADRATILGAFGTVDAITIFDDDTPLELIRAIHPDVLIKGADYTVDTVIGSDIVLATGGEVRLAPLIDGKSSTRTIQKIGSKT